MRRTQRRSFYRSVRFSKSKESKSPPCRKKRDKSGAPIFMKIYSSTKIFFFAHISFNIFGQTVTLTSPRWALRNRSIRVRDCPMPPPMESGNSLLMIPW